MSLSDVGADRLVQMWVVPPQMPAQQTSAAGHYWRMSKPTRKKTAIKTAKRTTHRRGGRKWSAKVTRENHALELEKGVFTRKSPRAIARSLKRSAERSHARKSAPLRSAISMLTFYINRAGSGLSATQRTTLEAAKGELRKLFGKEKTKRAA
jgi:TPP-dependent indolepyruvate ferredoxin oxidoreductase alpha subunit